ncbi:uncharacterized protein LOC124943910 [Impatiens glandulifera]|uniref:uncharacterized protein LOC124943910 n=1 Tax=Impatiens glandulifera TaxID=253017 RepID=UPI001FB0EEBA|nr:uncharacterized protein LOC124943910 [Impatiens glandulifera]
MSLIRDVKDGECDTLLMQIPECIRVLIFIHTFQFNDTIDTRDWNVENDGTFNLKLAWELIRDRGDNVGWFNVVWSSKIILRHQFIMWLVFRERLSTRDRIKRYMDIPNSKCLLCVGNEETMNHLFGCCPFTYELWKWFTKIMKLAYFPSEWIDIKEVANMKVRGNQFHSDMFKCGFASIVYHVWAERNSRAFSKVRCGVEDVWRCITDAIPSLVLGDKS